METLQVILLLLVGLLLIVGGADKLVDGAAAIARRYGISEFVIGMTIVGIGTSAPELVVSLIGASEGNADIAIGNVVGSNTINTLFGLGITALIFPMAITRSNRRIDIPMHLGFTALVFGLGMTGSLLGFGEDRLGRLDAVILLLAFVLYICYQFKAGGAAEETEEGKKLPSLAVSVLLILLGLVALIFGGRLFVNNATHLARLMGASDKFIAVTVLAIGTSLPELATCIVAAAKKKGQLALGNIIGSNIFNLLLILGISGLITPLSFSGMDRIDAGVLLLAGVLLVTASWTGRNNKLDRFDGALLLLSWAGYMTWLIINL